MINKSLTVTLIAFSVLLAALNCYGQEKESKQKNDTKVDSSISITIASPEAGTASNKEALGEDEIVETILKCISAAEKSNDGKAGGKCLVSVFSRAYIFKSDGKLQKLCKSQQALNGTNSANSAELKEVSKIFAAAFKNSKCSVAGVQGARASLKLNDLKIKRLNTGSSCTSTSKDGRRKVFSSTCSGTASSKVKCASCGVISVKAAAKARCGSCGVTSVKAAAAKCGTCGVVSAKKAAAAKCGTCGVVSAKKAAGVKCGSCGVTSVKAAAGVKCGSCGVTSVKAATAAFS